MKTTRYIASVLALVFTALIIRSCGIYSFSGTSIQSDVKTVTINYIEYKAVKVNPSLSNDLTEAIRNQFKKMTKLDETDLDGDLEISGQVTGYDVAASAITANEVAARNKLTVTVKIQFTNRKHPEDDFDQSFSAYSEYDSENSLEAVESALVAEIIEKLVEDIFNASVAQW